MKIWCVLLLAAALSTAQDKQARGREILDTALAALGGERFLTMSDRIERGRAYSFYREQLSGLSRATIYTRYLSNTDEGIPGFLAVRERQAFGKDEDTAVLFTETDAWEITFRGARPMPQPTVDRYRDSTLRNVFYILRQRSKERGLIIEAMGADVLDNQPVDIVDITDSENRVVTVYFHRSTHLPVKQVYERRDPLTRDRFEEVTHFSKYRDVGGGVQWPFSIMRTRNGEKIYEMFSDSVAINQGLTDDRFALPADMKVLKPAR
jgi:hypothetical protein